MSRCTRARRCVGGGGGRGGGERERAQMYYPSICACSRESASNLACCQQLELNVRLALLLSECLGVHVKRAEPWIVTRQHALRLANPLEMTVDIHEAIDLAARL